MPRSKYFNEAALKSALDAGNISMAQIDDSCERILSGWYALPDEKRYPCAAHGGSSICIRKNVSTAQHKHLAREVATKSTVLLKNGPPKPTGGSGGGAALLPLARDRKLKIALIGSDAEKPYTAGGGSGHVANSNVAVSPLQAFRARGFDVTYASGCGGGGKEGAAAAAAAADVAIVFVSATSGEGHDRVNLSLSAVAGCAYTQEELIEAVAAKQSSVAVVMAVPGPVLTGWRDRVAAILCAFLPGEQYGNAVVDLLTGDAAPQARLPVTMPLTPNDQAMSEHQWPGVPSAEFPGHKEVRYVEGQIVGYRWYDKHAVAPAFAFGFGLTYGTFSYSALAIDAKARTVSFVVSRSTDAHQGACDTPQLYLSYPGADADATVPAKVLRHFFKTCEPSASLSYTLSDRDLSNWDVATKQWRVASGTFGVHIASAAHGGGATLSGSFTV
jgi:beta-glucosidase